MEKIKRFIESERGKDVFTVLIVVLVGLSSFGLGRLSSNEPKTGLYIEQVQIPANTGTNASYNESNTIKEATEASLNGEVKSATTVAKNFFASNRGQKYYPATCSAGKTIKQENRIYFATRESAEDAGYELSASCR